MSDEILSLVRPNVSGPINDASISAFSINPVRVKIQSPALLSILEASLRSDSTTRIIGALVGTRSSDGSVIEVEDCYSIPHEEKDDEVTIDEYNHKNLYHLYRKANPKSYLVGWFQTSGELDTVASLVHELFNSAEGTHPNPAIHLTLQSRDKSSNAAVPIINTYVSTPVGSAAFAPTSAAAAAAGANEASSNSLFTPIPYEITYNSAEALALSYSIKATEQNNSSDKNRNLVQLGKSYNDLITIESNLQKVNQLLDANIAYIEKILSGDIQVDNTVDKIGKFLISNLLLFSSNYEGFNKSFNTHIQDTLMIEYLVTSIKTQIELSAKLTSLV